MGARWQTRPRLIKAVNIITRTSHYEGFYYHGRRGFCTQWQTRPSARPGRTRGVAREAHPAEVAALCGIISYTKARSVAEGKQRQLVILRLGVRWRESKVN